MGIFSWFNRPGVPSDYNDAVASPSRKPRSAARNFSAAERDRLTSSFPTLQVSGNAEIRQALAPLRARSRNLANNTELGRRYIQLLKDQVIGDQGIRMIPNVRVGSEVDNDANMKLAKAWSEFIRPGRFTVDGQLSYVDVLKLFIVSLARDGELLAKHIEGRAAENRFGYAVQTLSPDHLDEQKTTRLGQSRRVIMGVEVNAFYRPTVYHLLSALPSEAFPATARVHHVPTAAREVLHAFLHDSANQVRGVPHMHAAIRSTWFLSKYQEAELVAAIQGAAKGGMFVAPDGEPHDFSDTDEDDEGEIVDYYQDAEPGTFGIAPEGHNFVPYDPTHPNQAFGDFNKGIKRDIAAGWGVSYHTLTGDLEGVNFSSAKVGQLPERDYFRGLQGFLTEHVCQVIYERWLVQAITRGEIDLPMRKLDQFLAPKWKARGWPATDARSESAANDRAIANGTRSRTAIAADSGEEWPEIAAELAEEQALADELGLNLTKTEGDDDAATPSDSNQNN